MSKDTVSVKWPENYPGCANCHLAKQVANRMQKEAPPDATAVIIALCHPGVPKEIIWPFTRSTRAFIAWHDSPNSPPPGRNQIFSKEVSGFRQVGSCPEETKEVLNRPIRIP